MQEMQETRVWSLGWKDPLEEGMAAHSSTLAWRIPWTEEPGGLRFIWCFIDFVLKKTVKVCAQPTLCKSNGAALSAASAPSCLCVVLHVLHAPSCLCVVLWSFSCIPNMFIITVIFVTVVCDLWCYHSLKARMTAFLAIKYLLFKGCTLFFQTKTTAHLIDNGVV